MLRDQGQVREAEKRMRDETAERKPGVNSMLHSERKPGVNSMLPLVPRDECAPEMSEPSRGASEGAAESREQGECTHT